MDKPVDSQYQNLPFTHSELDHEYGPNFHILSSPVLMTLLAKVCAKECTQPEANRLIAELYINMLNSMVNAEFPRKTCRIESRMIEHTERGVYQGQVLDPKTKVAIAAVARAGVMPSQIIFDRLNQLIDPTGVRLDFFLVSRSTDTEDQVTGASVSSSKIGGELTDRILLLPDPMGATGSSILETLDVYRENGTLNPSKKIAIHMIVTPEYLAKMKAADPEVIVYAIRLDRGLSSPEVLQTKPGSRWSEERGLNDVQYIVPGAGGVGEVMTNSWV